MTLSGFHKSNETSFPTGGDLTEELKGESKQKKYLNSTIHYLDLPKMKNE